MTIQFLRYIIAVAEAGSITEAAKKLHISQPSLSAAVKEAEREVGFKVFHINIKKIRMFSYAEDKFLTSVEQPFPASSCPR